VLFAALSILAPWRVGAEGLLGAVLAYPAMAAAPAGALVLWIGRATVGR
jgi:hypothetical protein